ncbi:hypothetical protein [Streptomyces sp. SM11]|uniref:hypothetical protein n=1 Tax=Streptomyces sp. SM11 TaxID=565557 RepID=UPI000CD4C9DD|nr:hypothetical protein [Streptomyces sp. SM11]
MATRRGFMTGASGIGTAAFLGYAATPQAAAAPVGDAASTATVSPRQAKNALLAVNAGMRTNYAVLKAELIKHLSPVVVVQNDAKVGRFTLVTESGQESANPVAETFELAKSIAHVPLGIFSVIASYLADHIPNCMNPAKVATHLIDLPGLENPADPVFTALDNLARIVQDNVAAEMVFPKDTKVADALKGREDLLSDEILIQLGTGRAVTKSAPTYNMTAGAVCPVK